MPTRASSISPAGKLREPPRRSGSGLHWTPRSAGRKLRAIPPPSGRGQGEGDLAIPSLARRVRKPLALLLLALPLLAAAKKPDPAKLLDQAIAAAGGEKALAGVQSVNHAGALTASIGGEEVSGTVTMFESREGVTRDEMDVAGMQILSITGPTGAFTSEAGIPKTLAGDDLVQAKAQAKFTPLGLLLHGKESGVKLRALDSEDGLDVLEVTPPGADPIVFSLDPKTHFVSKQKLTSKEGTVVTNYSDYRPESGIQIAHQIAVTQAGLTMTFRFDTVSVNGAVFPTDVVALPAASPAAVAATPLPAGREIALTNATGKTLNNVFHSDPGKNEWGKSLLPVDKLHDGDTAKLAMRCPGDLMITDTDGGYYVLKDVACSDAITLTLDKPGHLVAKPK